MYHVISLEQLESLLLHRNKKHTDVWGDGDSLATKLIFHFLRTSIFISSERVAKVYIKYVAYRRYKFYCVYSVYFLLRVILFLFCFVFELLITNVARWQCCPLHTTHGTFHSTSETGSHHSVDLEHLRSSP